MIIGLWPDENEVGQGVMKRKTNMIPSSERQGLFLPCLSKTINELFMF